MALGISAAGWLAVGTTAVGAYGASKASKAQDRATDAAMSTAGDANQLGRDELEWFKSVYKDQAPARDAAEKRTAELSDAQLAGMKTATTQAQELDAYNKSTFRPLEQKIVADSQAYDTPQRRMQAAAEAAADVDQSVAAARQANDMALARSGIAPGSARAMMVQEDTAGNAVKARAGAMTKAVRDVEQQGYARTMDAASLGRNLPSSQATQQQIATGAGVAGVGAANASLNAAQSGNATMQQGFSGSLNAVNAAGNLYSGLSNTLSRNSATESAGLFGAAKNIGTLMSNGQFFTTSDPAKKIGTGRMANTAKALAEVENTPVHEGWQFDPAKGGPDDGGEPHIGPMADDVQRISGEQAAPGGKVINLPDRMGRMEAALQELSKQVKSIKGRKPERAAA